MNMGTVDSFGARLYAKKNSFQAKMIEMKIVATNPGATMGRTIWSISRARPAPSTRAASSTSRGTSSKNERSIQTAIGRFMAV